MLEVFCDWIPIPYLRHEQVTANATECEKRTTRKKAAKLFPFDRVFFSSIPLHINEIDCVRVSSCFHFSLALSGREP